MKYQVLLEWSGYSRGYKIVEVEADNKEGAVEAVEAYNWNEISRHVIRDDTETHTSDVTIDDVEEVV